MSATPAAEPIDSKLPPTPAVRVTSSQLPTDISGCIDSTANITGMLSTTEESSPTSTLAQMGFHSV